MKWFIIAALFICALASVASLIDPSWIESLYGGTLDANSLEFAPVDLGELKPNEARTFTVTLHNRMRRSLELLPPSSTCGCVMLDADSVTLSAGASVQVPFLFRTPGRPGEVERTILLRPAASPELEWQVPLRGRVVAKIWAEPSPVIAEFDSPVENQQITVFVNHDEDVSIGSIRSSSPVVRIDSANSSPRMWTVNLTLIHPSPRKTQQGSGILEVLSEDGQSRLLEIPISWAPRPPLQCVPKMLQLDKYGAYGINFERTLAVFVHSPDTMATLRVEPAVPWIHVERVDRRGGTFSVVIRFASESMPDRIDGSLLRLTVDDGKTWADLRAWGRR